VTIACSGFVKQAIAIGKCFGFSNIRIAEYPGHIKTHEVDTRMKNYQDVLLPQIVKLLTERAQEEKSEKSAEPRPDDIVYEGSFEEVNEYFHENRWSDGLPIVPPTPEKVNEFMKYTGRSPGEQLGLLLPANREITVWKIGVNGVMAGCRPEYMPILIAIVEAMADPKYRIQDGGSTPGWEAIIILNGPIRNQLAFNYQEAVLRPGYQANTSIGRFYRMFCRNVAGLLPGITDKATFGQPFRPVLPENEEVCEEIGWKPLSVLRGFNPGENCVTITSVRSASDPVQTTGGKPEHHLDYIVDWVKRIIEPYRASEGESESNVVILSPTVARLLAKGGYSKDDIKQYIKKHAVLPAHEFERNVELFRNGPCDLCDEVQNGKLAEEWCQSTDPNRLVPLMLPSTDWLIVVSGDPARNRCLVCRQNFEQGWAVSKKIELPGNWDELIRRPGKF